MAFTNEAAYCKLLKNRKRSSKMAKEAFDRQEGNSKKVTDDKAKKQPDHLAAAVQRTAARKARLEASKGPAVKAEHTVVSGDTLSGLAAKYYGSGSRENWMAIYEANKEVIGDNPSAIRIGQVLQIPELKD
jgi:nucleoid-associated protein YgaU